MYRACEKEGGGERGRRSNEMGCAEGDGGGGGGGGGSVLE